MFTIQETYEMNRELDASGVECKVLKVVTTYGLFGIPLFRIKRLAYKPGQY